MRSGKKRISYIVHVQVEPPFKRRLQPEVLRQAARAALAHQRAPAPAALTLRVADDDALRQLNHDFLGHDYPTDVLSFPADELEDGAPAGGERRYLGDIAISLPRAEAQAQAGRHPLAAELQLLAVHGVLHLIGHDHATRRGRARMWKAQAEILTGLGAPITGPAPEAGAKGRRPVTKRRRRKSLMQA